MITLMEVVFIIGKLIIITVQHQIDEYRKRKAAKEGKTRDNF